MHMCLHQCSSCQSMCTQAVCSLSTHEGRAGWRVDEGRLVSFFSPSLPVSNQDKSSASEEVLLFKWNVLDIKDS